MARKEALERERDKKLMPLGLIGSSGGWKPCAGGRPEGEAAETRETDDLGVGEGDDW